MDSAFLVYFMVLVCWDYSEIFTSMLTLKLGMTKKVNEPMSSGLYCQNYFYGTINFNFLFIILDFEFLFNKLFCVYLMYVCQI